MKAGGLERSGSSAQRKFINVLGGFTSVCFLRMDFDSCILRSFKKLTLKENTTGKKQSNRSPKMAKLF